MSPLTTEASLLRALRAFGSAWLDANNRRFTMIDLTLSKSRLFNSITPAEGFFCLTNAYVKLAIIIVLAYEEGPVLDSLAALWNSRCWLRQAPVRVGRRRLLYRHLADAGHGTAAGAEHVRLNRGAVAAAVSRT